jgi:mono/diheme cytochrome c family protein
VFALAQWHPAKSEQKPVTTGSAAQHGQALFDERCARCHETGVAPELAGSGISLAAARTQIENGGGGMPADLVTGQDLEDVLAYLETILER